MSLVCFVVCVLCACEFCVLRCSWVLLFVCSVLWAIRPNPFEESIIVECACVCCSCLFWFSCSTFQQLVHNYVACFAFEYVVMKLLHLSTWRLHEIINMCGYNCLWLRVPAATARVSRESWGVQTSGWPGRILWTGTHVFWKTLRSGPPPFRFDVVCGNKQIAPKKQQTNSSESYNAHLISQASHCDRHVCNSMFIINSNSINSNSNSGM